ncbi:MAG: hypothetical protein QM764_06620 [Chitinophagaceae bacterium]
MALGRDMLPLIIRNSEIFSDANLDQLCGVNELPVINPSFEDNHLKQIIQYYSLNPDEMEKELHLYAKKLLGQGKIDDAWQVLLAGNIELD